MAMVGERVGENRADALWRIVFVLLLVFGTILFSPAAIVLGLIWLIAVIAATIWFLVDVIWQLVTDSSGWTERSMGAAGWLERLVFWPIDMVLWAVFGRDDFPWTP